MCCTRIASGFENFDTKNEFEQLLINFTNESLQDTFNKQVFNNELKLYEEEGIDVVVSTCPDNAECLKMLTAKPKGIIPRCERRGYASEFSARVFRCCTGGSTMVRAMLMASPSNSVYIISSHLEYWRVVGRRPFSAQDDDTDIW